jgi:hypothetical protein
MDIRTIRGLLGEWFQPAHDPLRQDAEADYTEAREAMRALKSLFQNELESRHVVTGTEAQVRDDRTG